MTEYYAESETVAADLERRDVPVADISPQHIVVADYFILTISKNSRIGSQYARNGGEQMPEAQTAMEAADLLLLPEVAEVRMKTPAGATDAERHWHMRTIVAWVKSHVAAGGSFYS